ncbi:hypothetical protein KY361_04255 [Candidatus Woesearchaeota archaeon]|nr:hypothetical protein [Candidatus Woesearchaeota archaeon]
MKQSSIKDYLFNKLFFPKVVVIDRPGVIINKTSSRYGSRESKKRMVWCFEDILVNLQRETIKKLGKEKTAEMYYKVGKEIGTMYMLMARTKRPPSFLIPTILNYISKNLGFLSIIEATHNLKKKSFVLKGRDTTLACKTGEHSIFVGGFSAILSFLVGENIEGELKYDNYPGEYLYMFNKRIREKFIPHIKKLRPDRNYDKLNFPAEITVQTEMNSFGELMKFKKIRLEEPGKFYFTDKLILPATTEFLNLIANHYVQINERRILEDGIINGAKKLAEGILRDKKTEEDKIKTIRNMLCAFGWGIPQLRKKERGFVFDFVYSPMSQYGFLYQSLVLNGYLNYIFNKNLKIEEVQTSTYPIKISIHFTPI